MGAQLQLMTQSDDREHAYMTGKQLLKWIGNKQRFAAEIISYIPETYGTYFEPFVGSGAVLGTLAPRSAVAGDILSPLIGLWKTLVEDPDKVIRWYETRWTRTATEDPREVYLSVREAYNATPNAADLLYISRACYGGVMRFRQRDGHISTPCGIHRPISAESFRQRVQLWHRRVQYTNFIVSDFEPLMARARRGDVVYCDPPYVDSQRILYGAQGFSIERLFRAIRNCKDNGVRVLLSVDGIKKSGRKVCPITLPEGLFEREVLIDCGHSMLRRFQMTGSHLRQEVVHDRLLLTW